jgi:hypothetical protein
MAESSQTAIVYSPSRIAGDSKVILRNKYVLQVGHYMKLTIVTWCASITGTKVKWARGAFWLVDDLGDLAGAWQEGLDHGVKDGLVECDEVHLHETLLNPSRL